MRSYPGNGCARQYMHRIRASESVPGIRCQARRLKNVLLDFELREEAEQPYAGCFTKAGEQNDARNRAVTATVV